MVLDHQVEIKVQTLTPVWTGDNNGETSYLRATSFLGGLRFWTEALLRSFGKYTCNITNNDDRCLYDPKNNRYACSACKIFGCTNLGRSFRMKVIEGKRLTTVSSKKILLRDQEYTQNNRHKIPTYYPKGGLHGTFSIGLIPLRGDGLSSYLVAGLKLMLDWGSLGAQDQYGQGLVKAETEKLADHLQQLSFSSGDATDTYDLPKFSDFFFFYCEMKDSEQYNEEHQFKIRNKVRNSLRENQDQRSLRHYFCGSLSNPKQGTKYNISQYNNKLFGWGWFPRSGEHSQSRDLCLNNLKNELKKIACNDSLYWKEYNSSRDQDSPSTWSEYVWNMLNKSWREEEA